MAYVEVEIPVEVYHLTKRANLDSILSSRTIKRFGDTECWFCRSIRDMQRYMNFTVLREGQPYYGVGGILKFYPPFVPEDYVVLKLLPRYREGNWFKWNQELPADSTPELVKLGKEFSDVKIGYRGDLRFKHIEVIELYEILDKKGLSKKQ